MHDTRRLAFHCKIWLCVPIALTLLSLTLRLWPKLGGMLVENIEFLRDVPLLNVAMTIIVAILLLIPILLQTIWVYQSARNNRLTDTGLRAIKPGWLALWYFIPIVNLFAAYPSLWRMSRAALPTQKLIFILFWACLALSWVFIFVAGGFEAAAATNYWTNIDTTSAKTVARRLEDWVLLSNIANLCFKLIYLVLLWKFISDLTLAQRPGQDRIFD